MGTTTPPPHLDYAAFLDFLQAYGHNFFRLYAWEQARYHNTIKSDDFWFEPSVYERTGPGRALDGKPTFNLDRFNESYFERLRTRVIEAGRRGIYVSVMLFNGWSIQPKAGSYADNNPWRAHPFNAGNNVNGISGDVNDSNRLWRILGLGMVDGGRETHVSIQNPVNPYQKAYVRKVVDAVNDLDNVLYEISNESPADSTEWQYDMIRYIRAYEAKKAKQHPIGMTATWPGGKDAVLFRSPADWISPNNETKDYLNNPPVATGDKVIVSDTDHLCGVCGKPQWPWKSFTRGEHLLFMDVYDGQYPPERRHDPQSPSFVSIRKQLGYIVTFARKMDLKAMTPQPELCSTGYCLVNLPAHEPEYLVYRPDMTDPISVDLSAASGPLSVEWFDPRTGTSQLGARVRGGGRHSFAPPFSGEAVLYIKKVEGPRRAAGPGFAASQPTHRAH
ncbi:MAG: DUF6298 domain-containing protein [Nitrospiraceae bacterium]